MGVFKKNPVFSTLLLVCVLVFVAGVYFAFVESAKVAKTEKRIDRAVTEYQGVQSVDPAPTAENVAASEQNVVQLEVALERIRQNLQKGSSMAISDDGVSVMAGIQQFISEFKYKAANHVRVIGATQERVAAPVLISKDFAFGFEQYAEEARIPDDASAIPQLDKQRQILSYILTRLLDSNPHEIKKVERELIELPVGQSGVPSGYRIDPAVTARVAGAIDTLAFRISFVGYSRSLRQFLNSLADFDMPIVVRSINVSRPKVGKSKKSKKSKSANNLDAIFGSFGAGGDDTAAEVVPTKTPVVEDNVSIFTLDLEFIEDVLSTKPSETQVEANAS